MALLVILAACGGGGDPASPDQGAPRDTTTPTTESPAPGSVPSTEDPGPGDDADDDDAVRSPPLDEGPSAEELRAARTQRRLVVTGPEEVVFDWTSDSCEPEHIPDIATRAIRDAEGRVQLIVGHYVTYRMVGPHLDEVATDCSGPILSSDFDPDPAQFDDSEWLASPYTVDGETVYAIVHNEYRGVTHDGDRPGNCPSNDNLTCLDTSMTMAISTDGGDTYTDIAAPPGHLVASLPYEYRPEGVPSGYRQPSNIVEGPDGYHYVFSNVSDYPESPGDFPPQWMCAMRTDDLSDPSAWRYWDGEDFAGVFRDPYRDDVDPRVDRCAPLAPAQVGGGLTDSVTFNETLQSYVAVGMTADAYGGDPRWGVYYSLSDDLVNWSTRRFMFDLTMGGEVDDANDLFYAYPALLDPDSTSMNFATTDDDMYLYVTRFNAGGNSLDRDLIRFPVEVQEVTLEAPAWDFDSDTGGWTADNHLGALAVSGGVVSTVTTGTDPYMVSPTIDVPGLAYPTLRVTMTATADQATTGEVYFLTEADPLYDGTKYTSFLITTDGEPHTYEIDMSDIAGWDGIVRKIRIDPGTLEGVPIEIDSVGFGP